MDNNQRPTNWSQRLGVALAGVLSGFALFVGCAAHDSETLDVDNPSQPNPTLQEAQGLLFDHQIQDSNQRFNDVLKADPSNGEAAAGKAITDILLLPYTPEFTNLIRRNLGASGALNPQQDVVYSDGGLLYLLGRGVPYEDGSSFPGIKTLLVDDLPWTSRQLSSVTEFVNGLDQPVNSLMDSAVEVANAMGPIQTTLTQALEDKDFKTIFVPGEVFHDRDLSLVVGKTELSAIQTILSGTRAVIYFAAAYDWSFTLDEAFGDQWDNVALEDPDYTEGFDTSDYTLKFLDSRVFRLIRDPSHLEASRNHAKSAATAFMATLGYGQNGAHQGELDFSTADPRYLSQLTEFVGAVAQSTDSATTLPYTDPQTTMDLSSFFVGGRSLPVETRWLEPTVFDDDFGTYVEWNLTDLALETIFIEGVFDPEFTADEGFDLTMDGQADELGTSVAGPLQEDVEDAYFSGR